ncbi:hypothetical protein N431DRAFT_456045 [Stipitochalara longipes BDJ]|nr:hypothetical protein N431DRAFT_456045 [Stipitochalara longipes BDJ]
MAESLKKPTSPGTGPSAMPGLSASKYTAELLVPAQFHMTVPTNIVLDDIRLRLEALKVSIDGPSRPHLMARLQMAYLGWVSSEHEAKLAKFFRLLKTDLIVECQESGLPASGTVPQMRRILVLNAKEDIAQSDASTLKTTSTNEIQTANRASQTAASNNQNRKETVASNTKKDNTKQNNNAWIETHSESEDEEKKIPIVSLKRKGVNDVNKTNHNAASYAQDHDLLEEVQNIEKIMAEMRVSFRSLQRSCESVEVEELEESIVELRVGLKTLLARFK